MSLQDLLAGDDAAAIMNELRTMHDADLMAVAEGRGHITAAPDTRTLTDVESIPVSAAARNAAARARALRDRGAEAARSALAALGYAYHGTGGWHITAYATPGSQLGFVNIARGVAVETSVVLDSDVVEALTLPGQPEGPQASGAVAWASPDPGEAHRASAPAGWVQMLADLRAVHGKASVTPRKDVEARIVAWCLQTCYNRPGDPGYTTLDGQFTSLLSSSEGALDPQEWPCSDPGIREEANEAGRAALLAITRQLAETAGCLTAVDEALAPRDSLDIRLSRASLAADSHEFKGDDAYSPGGILRTAMGAYYSSRGPCGSAAREAGISHLAIACDATGYTSLIAVLLARIIFPRLAPAAEALAAALPQRPEPVPPPDDQPAAGWSYQRVFSFQDMLAGIIRKMADDLLSPFHDITLAGAKAMTDAYRARGPVEVDIPLDVPGHLPWDPDQPVGLEEIRERLGVERDTADKWRQRGVLPEPTWQAVGGRAAWRWSVIENWAVSTGRLMLRNPR